LLDVPAILSAGQRDVAPGRGVAQAAGGGR
jgi:hypothetical protein